MQTIDNSYLSQPVKYRPAAKYKIDDIVEVHDKFNKYHEQVGTIEEIKWSDNFDTYLYYFKELKEKNINQGFSEKSIIPYIPYLNLRINDKVIVQSEDAGALPPYKFIYTVQPSTIVCIKGNIFELHMDDNTPNFKVSKFCVKPYNKVLDLCKLLKGQEGKEFYCSLLDCNVKLKSIDYPILIFTDDENNHYQIFSHGGVWKKSLPVIFPDKNHQTWENYTPNYHLSIEFKTYTNNNSEKEFTQHNTYMFHSHEDMQNVLDKINKILNEYPIK